MVAATYDAAMVRVFADEGGYTNDPKDPGGPTNWGITIFDARKYWKPNATAEDVKTMPREVAAAIYKQHYAAPIRYNDLPAGFDYSILDASINSGLGRAIPWAGRALGTNSVTIEPVVAFARTFPDKVALIQKYWALRVSFLHGLSTWSHFGPGWSRRCAGGEAAAVRMWLTQSTFTPIEQRKKMDGEGKKASDKMKRHATAGAATGGAATAPASFDISHLSLTGKVALGVFFAVIAIAVIAFARTAIFNSQRSAAYKAASGGMP